MFIYIHILSFYKLLLYFNLCVSVTLDNLSCSFTFICFLTNSLPFYIVIIYHRYVWSLYSHTFHTIILRLSHISSFYLDIATRLVTCFMHFPRWHHTSRSFLLMASHVRGRRDRMVVGFIITNAINAHHH